MDEQQQQVVEKASGSQASVWNVPNYTAPKLLQDFDRMLCGVMHICDGEGCVNKIRFGTYTSRRGGARAKKAGKKGCRPPSVCVTHCPWEEVRSGERSSGREDAGRVVASLKSDNCQIHFTFRKVLEERGLKVGRRREMHIAGWLVLGKSV